MIKSKRYYAERVILALTNGYPNIDWKLDERLVFPAIDDVVNKLAEKNYFDNWQLSGENVDEQFITTWDEVEVIDPDNKNDVPSYLILPANYAALPNNRGIDEVWPKKYQMDGRNYSVVIMSKNDVRRYSDLQAGRMEGRLVAYPEGRKLVFKKSGVKSKYGNMGVRLVVKDSSSTGIDDPYPIPSNLENQVIDEVIEFFAQKRAMPQDTVRDQNDKP